MTSATSHDAEIVRPTALDNQTPAMATVAQNGPGPVTPVPLGTATAVAAISSSPIQLTPDDVKKVLATALAISESSSALTPMLTSAALQAIGEVGANAPAVLSDFKALKGKLEAAPGLAAQQLVLLSKEAKKYRLDALLEEEVASRKLVQTVNGYIDGHVLTTLWDPDLEEKRYVMQSRLNSTTESFAARLLNADASIAEPARQVVEGLFGIDLSAPSSLANSFNQLFIDAGVPVAVQADMRAIAQASWDSFLLTGQLPPAGVDAVLSQMCRAGAERLVPEIVKLEGAVQSATKLVESFKEFDTSQMLSPSGLGNMRAGAAALSGLLGALGNHDQAREVSKAASYLGAAVQVQQSVALMMSVGTGWGMASAFMGLASGTSGLGIFGGPGLGATGSEQSQAAVLGAIADLKTTMLSEFAKVNKQLAEMAETLSLILDEVRKANAKLELVYQRLKEVDDKLTVVLLRLDRSFYKLVEDLQNDRNMNCLSQASESPKNALGVSTIDRGLLLNCIGFYARLATDASGTLLTPSNDLTEAQIVEQLEKAYSADTQETNGTLMSKDAWRSIGMVNRLLMVRGIAVDGKPTSAPILITALKNLSAMYEFVGPAPFGQIVDRASLAMHLEAAVFAADQHAMFMKGIQGASGKWIVEKLCQQIEVSLRLFSSSCESCLNNLRDEMLGKISRGENVDYCVRLSENVVFNHNGSGGWGFLDATRFAASGSPNVRLFMTDIQRPNAGGSAPHLRSTMGANYSVLDKTWLRWVLKIQISANMYGEDVAGIKPCESLILFDGVLKTKAEQDRIAGLIASQDFSGLMSSAKDNGNGVPGVQYKNSFRDDLNSQDNSQPGSVWRIAGRRLERTGLVMRAFSKFIKGQEPRDSEEFKHCQDGLRDAWNATVLLRSVLRTAYETAYNQCDALQALFDGSDEQRLLSPSWLLRWASSTEKIVEGGKFASATDHPGSIALKRFDMLKSVLGSFPPRVDVAGVPINLDEGRSVGFLGAASRVRQMKSDLLID